MLFRSVSLGQTLDFDHIVLFQITADTKVAAGAENASQKFAQTAFIKVKLYDTDAGEGLSNEAAPRGGRRAGAKLGSFGPTGAGGGVGVEVC